MSQNPEATVNYFGYGANASPDMMEAMVGRVPEGQTANLINYMLTIQLPHQIPERVRCILSESWSPSELDVFRTYAIRRRANEGREVRGMLWKLTPLERELVDNWEMNDGLWYRKLSVPVFAMDGLTIASTEEIDDPALEEASMIEPRAPEFLNNKKRMLEVADAVRVEYLAKKNLA